MPDTNINAFYMDVDEKKAAVDAAKAELASAEARLTAKQEQDKTAEKQVTPKEPAKPHKVTRSAKDGKFVDKDQAKKEPDTTITQAVGGQKPAHQDERARLSPTDEVLVKGTARNPKFTSKDDHKNV